MIARMSEVLHEWMGWCPGVQPRLDGGAGEPAEIMDSSSQRGSSITRLIDWLGLFRNQVFLLAIWFSVVGYLLLLTLGRAP